MSTSFNVCTIDFLHFDVETVIPVGMGQPRASGLGAQDEAAAAADTNHDGALLSS